MRKGAAAAPSKGVHGPILLVAWWWTGALTAPVGRPCGVDRRETLQSSVTMGGWRWTRLLLEHAVVEHGIHGLHEQACMMSNDEAPSLSAD